MKETGKTWLAKKITSASLYCIIVYTSLYTVEWLQAKERLSSSVDVKQMSNKAKM